MLAPPVPTACSPRARLVSRRFARNLIRSTRASVAFERSGVSCGLISTSFGDTLDLKWIVRRRGDVLQRNGLSYYSATEFPRCLSPL